MAQPSFSSSSAGIARPLVAASTAVARMPTHHARHIVDAPVVLKTPALSYAVTRVRTLRLSVSDRAQAALHCAGTARGMGGAGYACRGKAVPKTAEEIIATHNHLYPSRSRGPCRASLQARSARHRSSSVQALPLLLCPRPLARRR